MASIETEQTTTIVEATRLVCLTYLQTVAALDDQSTLSQLAGESPGSNNTVSGSSPADPGFLGIGGEGASTVTSSFTDTGWSISRTWLETWWDKIRWAIGLREIGVFAYEYAQSSEVVSVPYRSPKEIAKVLVRVDEQIPSVYPLTNRWIHYFVSPDNGANWHRINPIDHPTIYSGEGGEPVPRIINFNADFQSENDNAQKFVSTEIPVTEIRFRAVLIRPGDTEFEGTSPVLKSYRMSIYPKEGLQ